MGKAVDGRVFITFTARGNNVNGSAIATLTTDCLRGIGNCGITIISYSSPRRDVRKLHRRRVKLVSDDACFGTLTYSRFHQVGGGTCAVIGDGTIGTLSSTREVVTARSIGPSIIFFSVPNALQDGNIVGALSRVSCVFAPLDTSHFIIRDALGFIAVFHSELVAAKRTGAGKLRLF